MRNVSNLHKAGVFMWENISKLIWYIISSTSYGTKLKTASPISPKKVLQRHPMPSLPLRFRFCARQKRHYHIHQYAGCANRENRHHFNHEATFRGPKLASG